MRSENMGFSSTHSAASSCWTMAATIGGVPRAAPMPVSPLSVSTRISVASLLTLVPRSVRWRFSSGTGADIGIADTLTIFMGRSSLVSRSHLDFGWPSRSIAECHKPRYFEAGDLVFASARLQNRSQVFHSAHLFSFSPVGCPLRTQACVRLEQQRAMSRLSAAALPVDLHIGEKRHKRMGTHRDNCAGVECYQRLTLLRRQAEAIGV